MGDLYSLKVLQGRGKTKKDVGCRVAALKKLCLHVTSQRVWSSIEWNEEQDLCRTRQLRRRLCWVLSEYEFGLSENRISFLRDPNVILSQNEHIWLDNFTVETRKSLCVL
ncbi:hypothetical protein L1049_026377 [Liquidambar formosana]|uniref:Uncharacterized protein n=1 Tax=Liquidambar formosana TaxID=63359 RepID=A0AAP0R5F1_LIQFO